MPELIAATRANRNLNRDLVELAAEAIGNIGPKAASAVPALVDLLGVDDSNVHGRAAIALTQIGPEAIPALVKADFGPLGDQATRLRLGHLARWAPANCRDSRPSPLEIRSKPHGCFGSGSSVASNRDKVNSCHVIPGGTQGRHSHLIAERVNIMSKRRIRREKPYVFQHSRKSTL